MCELLALNAHTPTAATLSFSGRSSRGGRTGPHVNGWGMAFRDGEAARVFHDTDHACDAPLAAFLCEHPLRARMLLSEGRAFCACATTPLALQERCHPFTRARLIDCDLEIDLASENRANKRMVVVATQPLTDTTHWRTFMPGELRVFVDGASVWERVLPLLAGSIEAAVAA